ncbi:hypothetical protein JTB14_010892 [Gonioctena quinquepunctata]|nr:hypothetical protein JTB14_010892 [Gonioctena quinquepunctata]
MDPLPLITKNFSNHEVSHTLRGSFQNTLNGLTYPQDIAKNILRNIVDDELPLKQTAAQVLQVYNDHEGTLDKIQDAGTDIMAQKSSYMITKHEISMDPKLREILKLKRCDLFRTLRKIDVDEFGLIQASDLFLDIIRQYLDYRYYTSTSHICDECSKKRKVENLIQKKKKKQTLKSKPQANVEQTIMNTFKIMPNEVTFHNCEIGQIYTEKLKIMNTSLVTQSLSLKALPKLPYFILHLDQKSKIAPGMSVPVTVTFKPKLYRDLIDEAAFKNGRGDSIVVPIKCSRDPPKLITCVFKSNFGLMERCLPGNEDFLEKRRQALNSTIDCGCCLVSQYVVLSIVIENKGMPGTFFIISEEEWFSQDIKAVSQTMELCVGGFWIYPTFFQIHTDEIIEINVIFQPTRPGLHLETLYLICDNNSFQQLEIMGDALEFRHELIRIDVPPRDTDISRKEGYCVYFGNIENKSSRNLIITVHNNSYLYLSCSWKFRNKNHEGVKDFEERWIRQKNYNSILIPYSTSDFEFEISLDAEFTGYHSIFISLFVSNVPVASLRESEEFIVIERSDISGETLSSAVDARITEFEIACFIDFPVEIDIQPPPR